MLAPSNDVKRSNNAFVRGSAGYSHAVFVQRCLMSAIDADRLKELLPWFMLCFRGIWQLYRRVRVRVIDFHIQFLQFSQS